MRWVITSFFDIADAKRAARGLPPCGVQIDAAVQETHRQNQNDKLFLELLSEEAASAQEMGMRDAPENNPVGNRLPPAETLSELVARRPEFLKGRTGVSRWSRFALEIHDPEASAAYQQVFSSACKFNEHLESLQRTSISQLEAHEFLGASFENQLAASKRLSQKSQTEEFEHLRKILQTRYEWEANWANGREWSQTTGTLETEENTDYEKNCASVIEATSLKKWCASRNYVVNSLQTNKTNDEDGGEIAADRDTLKVEHCASLFSGEADSEFGIARTNRHTGRMQLSQVDTMVDGFSVFSKPRS